VGHPCSQEKTRHKALIEEIKVGHVWYDEIKIESMTGTPNGYVLSRISVYLLIAVLKK